MGPFSGPCLPNNERPSTGGSPVYLRSDPRTKWAPDPLLFSMLKIVLGSFGIDPGAGALPGFDGEDGGMIGRSAIATVEASAQRRPCLSQNVPVALPRRISVHGHPRHDSTVVPQSFVSPRQTHSGHVQNRRTAATDSYAIHAWGRLCRGSHESSSGHICPDHYRALSRHELATSQIESEREPPCYAGRADSQAPPQPSRYGRE